MTVRIILLAVTLTVILALYIWSSHNRRYKSSASVAAAYDAWTEDRLLEILWGEHIHLGHYGNPPRRCDFRQAKEDFVHALVHWSGLDKLPLGSRVLDVGCGIGGSARILAQAYGFNVIGVSISPAQIRRATELTPANLHCCFQVMDALDLQFSDGVFDAVWSVEAGPHMPDKQLYADELQRVLRRGGLLAIADWNRRDSADGRLSWLERWVMRQLLDQWSHPEFASITGFSSNLEASRFNQSPIISEDWTQATLPSWIDAILEGGRRPNAVLELGPRAVIQGLREIPTLLLMRWAFAHGLMQFGVFHSVHSRT